MKKEKLKILYQDKDIIVVSKDTYMYKYNIVDKLKNNGILILNTSLDEENLKQSLHLQ